MIFVPLLDKDPTHRPAHRLPRAARTRSRRSATRVEADGSARRIHVIGFAKLVGDLIDGLMQVALYFGAGRADRHRDHLSATPAACAAPRWWWPARWSPWSGSSGWWRLLGFELDPYSILVPFLVFAIGVSHGAQKMNGIMQDIGRGTHKLVAARYTFRRLFLAGLTALLADAVGFAVLMMIDIPVIQDLALTASIGVAVLIFTNLMLLPVLLSYIGVSAGRGARAACATSSDETRGRGFSRLWRVLDALHRAALGDRRGGRRRRCCWRSAASLVSTHLKIGDLDPGAPELRADSRYNRDNAYITGQLLAVQRQVRGHRQDRRRKAA